MDVLSGQRLIDVLAMTPTIALVVVYVAVSHRRLLASVVALACLLCVYTTLPVVRANPPIWHGDAIPVIRMGFELGIPGAACVFFVLTALRLLEMRLDRDNEG